MIGVAHAHAVTPTDNRRPSLPHEEREDVGALAHDIAEHGARCTLQQHCPTVVSEGHTWHDTAACELPVWYAVDRAFLYLQRRGDRIGAYRLVVSCAFPRLVRFEEPA